MATQTTEMRRPKKRAKKPEPKAILKAKEALLPKISNPSTPVSEPKSESGLSKGKVIDWFFPYRTYKQREATEAFLDKLTEGLLEWAAKPTSIKMQEFLEEFDISEDSLKYWRTKYPQVGQAYAVAKKATISHRETGAIKNLFNATAVLNFQGLRDPEYREYLKEKASWSQPQPTNYEAEKGELPVSGDKCQPQK